MSTMAGWKLVRLIQQERAHSRVAAVLLPITVPRKADLFVAD